MKGEKIESEPCDRCQGEIFYSNCGSCVSCVSDRNDAADKERRANAAGPNGIRAPYDKCYEQGRKAQSLQDNPYSINQIGARCAWAAGFNDNH